jgi:hypothetical protein
LTYRALLVHFGVEIAVLAPLFALLVIKLVAEQDGVVSPRQFRVQQQVVIELEIFVLAVIRLAIARIVDRHRLALTVRVRVIEREIVGRRRHISQQTVIGVFVGILFPGPAEHRFLAQAIGQLMPEIERAEGLLGLVVLVGIGQLECPPRRRGRVLGVGFPQFGEIERGVHVEQGSFHGQPITQLVAEFDLGRKIPVGFVIVDAVAVGVGEIERIAEIPLRAAQRTVALFPVQRAVFGREFRMLAGERAFGGDGDHARRAVGAVNIRLRAAQNFDLLDQLRVDLPEEIADAGRESFVDLDPVHHDQKMAAAETAQFRVIELTGTARLLELDAGGLPQDFGGVGVIFFLDFLFGNDGYRLSRKLYGRFDLRRGDDDIGQRIAGTRIERDRQRRRQAQAGHVQTGAASR